MRAVAYGGRGGRRFLLEACRGLDDDSYLAALVALEQGGRRRCARAGEACVRELVRAGMNSPVFERVRSRMRSMSVSMVRPRSALYPRSLERIPDPPPVLFVRGNAKVLAYRRRVALVGTRRATPYGRLVAFSMGADLAGSGVVVVSGGALGVDASAHKGALRAGGGTVVVLGCGCDVHYPAANDSLFLSVIRRGGALVSEYLPGTPPARYRFPMRNRIISGMSAGVVVVEAGPDSGALITVSAALEQGREVMVVPGNVTSRQSLGCLRLLREGAWPVAGAEDVIGWLWNAPGGEALPLASPSLESSDSADPAGRGGSRGVRPASKETGSRHDAERVLSVLAACGALGMDDLSRLCPDLSGRLEDVLFELLVEGRLMREDGLFSLAK